MAQKLIQTQTQQQVQQQRLSQQQLLQVKLLEMPLAELEQSIGAELDDNPALEEKRDDDAPEQDNVGGDDASDTADDDSNEDRTEREEALDNALRAWAATTRCRSPRMEARKLAKTPTTRRPCGETPRRFTTS